MVSSNRILGFSPISEAGEKREILMVIHAGYEGGDIAENKHNLRQRVM